MPVSSDLWENADPDLQPIVEDVRERIARLVGERPRTVGVRGQLGNVLDRVGRREERST